MLHLLMSPLQLQRSKMKKIILIAFACFLFASPSFAQSKSPAVNSLAQWADDDLNAAQALAAAVPALQDGTGQACWKTVQSVAAILKAHPLPVTLKLASDIEAARLVAMGLNQICTDPNCSQVWVDTQNQIGALGVGPLPFSPASLCSKVTPIKSTPTVPTNAPVAVSK